MKDKGDLIWVLKVLEGSMGTAPPPDPPVHPARIPLLPPYSCHQSLKLSGKLRDPTTHFLIDTPKAGSHCPDEHQHPTVVGFG